MYIHLLRVSSKSRQSFHSNDITPLAFGSICLAQVINKTLHTFLVHITTTTTTRFSFLQKLNPPTPFLCLHNALHHSMGGPAWAIWNGTCCLFSFFDNDNWVSILTKTNSFISNFLKKKNRNTYAPLKLLLICKWHVFFGIKIK